VNRLVSNNERLWQQLCVVNSMRGQALAMSSNKPVVDIDGAKDIILGCLDKENIPRIIVGIGGFPASGKTTLAKALVRDINTASRATVAAYLPMDGFHFPNSRLIAEGREVIKGDIATYDVVAYVAKLLAYKQSFGISLFAPDYIREKHDVFENMIEISPESRVLVTEGIYVGHITGGGWGEVRSLLDILFYLDTDPEQCADRIVSRNLELERDDSMIEGKLTNDLRFMAGSVHILQAADYIIRPVTR
jgi:pantothenate kinase